MTPRTIQLWISQNHFSGAYQLNPNAVNSPYRIPLRAVEAFEHKRQEACG